MNVMGSPREDTSYETDLHCDEETKTDLMYYIIHVWNCIFSDTRNVFSLTPLLFGDLQYWMRQKKVTPSVQRQWSIFGTGRCRSSASAYNDLVFS